jgi:glycosyltransferase involved in cell wall biosynthesis
VERWIAELRSLRRVPHLQISTRETVTRKLAIIPAYNEAGAVASTIADLREHAPGWDILVVDDGSTDATARIARDAGTRVVQHPFNLGIGGAVQSGYQHALEYGYDFAVQFDGDGQHDARFVPLLHAHLVADEQLNMVTGSRFMTDDGDGYRSSAARRVGIRMFSWMLSRVTRRRITDPTSGLRMTDRSGIELFARDYPHDYPEVEAVLLLHAHCLNADEYPVRMRPRLTGTSSISSSMSAVYMTKVSLAVFVGLCRARPNVTPGDRAPVSAEHSL